MFFNFNGILNFVKGAANGANLAKQGKMLDCLNNANTIVDGANKTFTYLLSNFTLYGGLIGIDKGLSVVYAAGGLTSDCVQGVFEAETNALKYATFVSKPSLLYWNLIYNFGLLYNSIKSVIYFFILPTKNKITNTGDLGIQVGSFFYNLISS
jgi:hypothetical protein